MRPWFMLALAGCYAPSAITGAPCSDLRRCPAGQHCALVDGVDRCIAGDDPNDTDARPTVPWTLVQTRGDENDDVTCAATGSGHLIIVGVETSELPATDVADNAGNVYVRAAGSRASDLTEGFGIELWYAKSSLAGATRITAKAPEVFGVVMWEVAGIDTAAPLGPLAKLDDQPPSTTPVGAPITTTAPGMFVVSIAIVGNAVTGLTPGTGFKNDHMVFGNGWAHLDDPATPPGTYQAKWNQPNAGDSCATSAAFFARN